VVLVQDKDDGDDEDHNDGDQHHYGDQHVLTLSGAEDDPVIRLYTVTGGRVMMMMMMIRMILTILITPLPYSVIITLILQLRPGIFALCPRSLVG